MDNLDLHRGREGGLFLPVTAGNHSAKDCTELKWVIVAARYPKRCWN